MPISRLNLLLELAEELLTGVTRHRIEGAPPQDLPPEVLEALARLG